MFRRAKKHLTIQMMAALEPAMLNSLSEKKAVKAFQAAAAKVPAYRQFLKGKDISPSAIKTIDDFKKNVPVIDKENTFKLYSLEIKKLCLLGEIKDTRTIISSSGHSGCFSYGLNTQKEIEKSQDTIDFMLDYIFNAKEKKTILVNCLPMGVKIQASCVTVVDTSVRSDIVLGIIKTFAHCYDQVILVGENSFVKKVLEDGVEEGIDWKKIKLHLVLGEEILPENLRSYLANILSINPDDAQCQTLIGSSFGVAEFGLNVFYETKELIRIRRLLARDRALKETLIGRDPDNFPAILHYNPLRVFVEEQPKDNGLNDLVLTNLESDTNIPLVRYNIKDEGIKISFEDLKTALKNSGYDDYIPRIRMPLVAVWGRDKITTEDGFTFRPEFLKELLYSDRTVACNITGNFKLSNSKAGLRIEIQMKINTERSPDLENRIREMLLSKIPAKTEIIIYPYRDFPYGVELNYEKKFQYI
jgi:phenylacetate-CoA ligase